NVYVTGSTVTSEAFVAKLDTSLNLLWAQTTATTTGGTAGGAGIALDGSDNAYVTGSYGGTVTFGATTVARSARSLFVWELDANGSSTWVGSMGSNGVGAGIALDASGSIYVTGSWSGGSSSASNFNPGPGGVVQLTNNGHNDLFVVKLVPTAGGPSYTAQSP